MQYTTRHLSWAGALALLTPTLVVMAQTPPATTPAAQQGMQAGASTTGMQAGPPNPTANVVYTPVVYIDKGSYVSDKSRPADIQDGTVSNTAASGIKIKKDASKIGGFYIKDSDYTISDAVIDLSGDADNQADITGVGAGVVAGPGATVTLKNVKISTTGLRTAAATAVDGTLKVYNSTLIANGATIPFENTVVGSGPGYIGPPEPLGIRGNARATNAVGTGKAYYYNSTIIASGWGAMSTDSATPAVYLEMNDSVVKVTDSGYGAYADNGCTDVFNNTRFSSATYSAIISGNGKIIFNHVTEDKAVNSVMIHAPGPDFTRIATLNITGGKLATKDAVILVKSHNADISMDGVTLAPKNGVLIKSVINDSKRSAMMRWLLSETATTPNRGPMTGIRTSFNNMTMNGDIVHDDSARTMTLTLTGTQFKGAVLGSIYTITDVSLSLDGNSQWTATKDSRVTLLNATDEKRFDARKGITITAIAGKGTTLKGKYALRSGGVLNVKMAS